MRGALEVIRAAVGRDLGVFWALQLPLLDVRLEALVEVSCAQACRYDGSDEQQDRDDGEDGESLAGGEVFVDLGHVARVVHSDELEDEVGHGGEVDDDHDGLAVVGFAAGDEGGEEEETDGDGDRDDGEVELKVGEVRTDDDQELHREREEEEEIELEEGDVDLSVRLATLPGYNSMEYTHLECQVSPLEPQIRRDVLVDGPCELAVKLPGDSAEQNGTQGDDTGTREKEPVNLVPDVQTDLRLSPTGRIKQGVNGFLDLGHLHTRIDEHAGIVKAEPDDLNCVLRAQRIIHQDQLVQEAEDEQSQVCRDGM